MADGEGTKADGDRTVRAQYEDYPYPARDPADERRRLITGSPSHLLEIEHYVLAGMRAGALNALVAGGGTGDGAIMLAQQLADRGAGHVTYLDVSAASLEIARARAQVRGLDNIRFLQGSLLDVAELAPGPYDYIDCCGVLHHLDDPKAGLDALAAQLKPAGGMGLMVYAPLGRSGVYPLQAALRRLGGDAPPAERVALARRLLGQLPEGNLFRRNPYLGDHLQGDDAGLYDLLLHSRDRAYSVADLSHLVAASGLAISGFVPALQYHPAIYLQDPELERRAAALPVMEQFALAEELSGAIKTHVFYVVNAGPSSGGRADPDLAMQVPVLRDHQPDELADALARLSQLKATLGGVTVELPVPAGSDALVRLIDGRRNLRELRRDLEDAGIRLSWAEFRAQFRAVYALLQPLNLLLLAGRTG